MQDAKKRFWQIVIKSLLNFHYKPRRDLYQFKVSLIVFRLIQNLVKADLLTLRYIQCSRELATEMPHIVKEITSTSPEKNIGKKI